MHTPLTSKHALAFAIASVLAAPTTSQAIIDIDNSPAAVPFVGELQISESGKVRFKGGSAANVANDNAGFYDNTTKPFVVCANLTTNLAVRTDSDAYTVRMDLEGGSATFTNPLNIRFYQNTGAELGIASIDSGNQAVSQLPSGANTGVLIGFAPSAAVAGDTQLCFAADVTLGKKEDVTLKFALYDTKQGAEVPLSEKLYYEKSAPLITFGTNLISTISNADVTPAQIDVAAGNTQFVSGATKTPICSFALGEKTGVFLPDLAKPAHGDSNLPTDTGTGRADYSCTPVIDIVGANTTLVVEGNFEFALSGSSFATNQVFLSENADCSSEDKASDTLDATTATFNIGSNTPVVYANATATPTDPVYVCIKANGTTAISPAQYSAKYVPVSASLSNGAVSGSSALSFDVTETALTCAETTRSGTTESVAMFLEPNAAYTTYLRITNPSEIAGKVNITAVNDEGAAGGNTWTFLLGSKQSTGLITAQNIMDNTGVSISSATATVGGGQNKLRVTVNAEFGETGKDSAVRVRTYALSKDGNAFVEFK